MSPTIDQLIKINKFFSEKSLDLKCSTCGKSEWAAEDIIPPADQAGPKIFRRGSMVPLLQLECSSCGQVVFFNAEVLGLTSE